MKHKNNFILCCYIPYASTAFKENYLSKTRMFVNDESMHVLVNKLKSHHKQVK